MGALDKFRNGLSREVITAYDKLMSLDDAKLNLLVFAAVHAIEPVIREQLTICYSRSQLNRTDQSKHKSKSRYRNGDSPGKLFEMIVNDVKDQMVRNKTGLTLRYPGGYPKGVYIRASVFTTGGVYGTHLAISKASLKFKKTIKGLVKKGASLPAKTWIIPGRDLYKMTASQKSIISDAFDKQFEKLVTEMLG